MSHYSRLTWPLFIELIRLPAKAASMLPLALGVAYAGAMWHQWSWQNSLIYAIAQLFIAFFVTGFNNVQDYFKAKTTDYQQHENMIGRAHLSPRRMLALMIVFLMISVLFGLWLVARTNLSVLVIGAVGVGVSILYTFGPVPLSRLPLGEVLAGIVEGYGTFVIAVLINRPQPLPLDLTLSWQRFTFQFDLAWLLQLFLAVAPVALLNAGVMFADNISDLSQDISNQRFTLPYYLGKPRALSLYRAIPVLTFVLLILALVVRALPMTCLLVLGAWPLVRKNTRGFVAAPSKSKTFILTIHSLMTVGGALLFALLLEVFLS